MTFTGNKRNIRDKLLPPKIRKQTRQLSSVCGVNPGCCQISPPEASPAIPARMSLKFLPPAPASLLTTDLHIQSTAGHLQLNIPWVH